MQVKYFTEDKSCYLKGIVNSDIKFRIIKREVIGDNLNEIVEIYNNDENLVKELLNSIAVMDAEILYRNNKVLILKVKLRECKTFTMIREHYNKKNINEEKIENNYNIWNFDLDNVHEILGVKKKFIEITGNGVYAKIVKNPNKDIKLLPILRDAYDLGYFDVPKKVNLMELSKILDITPTKLNLIIRKILKNFLKENLKK